MLATKLYLTAILLLMIGTSGVVFRLQARAKTCPLHNRRVGQAAQILGYATLTLALALLLALWRYL